MNGKFFENNKILVLTAAIILFLLFAAYIARYAVIGYALQKNIKGTNYSIEDYGKSVQELRNMLLVSSTNLSLCNELNKKISMDLEKFVDRSSDYKSELSALKANFTFAMERCDDNIANLKKSYEERIEDVSKEDDKALEELRKLKAQVESELNNLKSQYDSLAQNAANNICCKTKVDNPRIRYYQIENNRVICLEEGAKALSC